jgi:hypothetical protein
LTVADNSFVRGGSMNLGIIGSINVDGELINEGIMLQTKNVGSSWAINFLQIIPNGGGSDR